MTTEEADANSEFLPTHLKEQTEPARLKESERNEILALKFKQFVKRSNVGIYMIQDNKSIYVNPCFAEVLGYDSNELLADVPLNNVVYPQDFRMVDDIISACLNGEKQPSKYELRGVRKDGQALWIEIRGSRSMHKSSPIIMGTLVDITARKEAELDLLRKNRENNERVKELHCLHMISEAVNDVDLQLADIFKQCASILPLSYQYPDITCVQIEYEDEVYRSNPFRTSPWLQSAPVTINGRRAGSIEVYYTEEKPMESEGPFLREERNLINSVVAILENCINRRNAENEILMAQENERIQIGMELHDNVKQILAASKIHLDIIRTNAEQPDLVMDVAKDVQRYICEAIDELRRLSHQLAPSVDYQMSICSKLTTLIKDLKLQDQLNVTVDAQEFSVALDSRVQLNIYRILQEQLNNVIQYSQAENLYISLKEKNNKLLLQIHDDGVGFDRQRHQEGIGLLNIRRRVKLLNGNLIIHSAPGKGCQVWVDIPLR